MTTQVHAQAKAPPALSATRISTPSSTGILQRKCACGGTPGPDGECAACRQKRLAIQRHARNNEQATSATVPPIVHDVLRSPGQPLDTATRTFMESRFGHNFSRVRVHNPIQRAAQADLTLGKPGDQYEREADGMANKVMRSISTWASGSVTSKPSSGYDFSQVRIHTNNSAASSARAVDARAYTVGSNIVFGEAQYSPETSEGQWLLAHELAHVIQQQNAPTPVVRRVGFFESIARLFGGGTFDDKELQDYLLTLDRTGTIEDHFDSDNKARAIVNRWRLGGSPFVLTAQRKALLIREMQSGYTSDADEQAILEILERSYNYELNIIFGTGGVNPSALNSDISGEEWRSLQSFYARRFKGGMEAVLRGDIQPINYPVPLGTDVRSVEGFLVEEEELPGAVVGWNIPCVLGILCSMDKEVVEKLPNLTVKVVGGVYRDNPYYDGAQWTTKRVDIDGFASPGLVGLLRSKTCAKAAFILKHEVRHLTQPHQSTLEDEMDAYISSEQWAIDRGLPGMPGFHRIDPVTGAETVDVPLIEQHVREKYAGISSVPGEQIVGRDASGKTIVRRHDGSNYVRPPVTGDSYKGPRQITGGESLVPSNVWVCPETKSK